MRVTEPVVYPMAGQRWYHIPDTDIEILIQTGPLTNVAVRKRLPDPKPKEAAK